jgi:hypothetical protein
MKVGIAVVFSALLLAGCAADQPAADNGSNNPLVVQCRAEGASGAAVSTCVKKKAALGVGRDSCQRKGIREGSAQWDTCLKNESGFTEATIQCQAEGQSSNDLPAFKACISRKNPEAAAYAMPNTN